MPTTTDCPSTAELAQLLADAPRGSHLQQVEFHLAGCAACRSALQALSDPQKQRAALLQRLDQLQSAAVASEATAINSPAGGGDTLSGSVSYLSPAQQAGELGRLGSFRVLKLLGEGGMGQVFLAQDETLHRTVALKVMRPHIAADPNARERFLREARANAAVHHDNVVTIFQIGEAPAANGQDRVPFVAMQLLQGEPLDKWLTRGKKLSLSQILRIGREIAQGLAAAHERGLIHRDIKPGNIWLEAPQGRVKILDFGLARAASENLQLTQSGAIVGTPAFMAPEQARSQKVDHRADLFSLGVVLYRLATGELPFQGDSTLAVLSALALDEPKPVRERAPDVPEALAQLIHRLLAKKPEQRPQTAQAVVESLTAIGQQRALTTSQSLTNLPPAAEPAPARSSSAPMEPVRRPRRRLPVAVVLAVLLLGGGVLAFLAPQLLRVQTETGELVVEVDDPTVEVLVKQGGLVVYDRSVKREYSLKPGEGEVEVFEKGGVGPLVTKKFTLNRGEKTVLSVRHEVAAVKKKPDEPKPERQPSPLDHLDPSRIPPEERVPELEKELVAVLGSSKRRPAYGTEWAAYSPDGSLVVTTGAELRYWDAKTFEPRGKWLHAAGWPRFSPDGRWLAMTLVSEVMDPWNSLTGLIDLKGDREKIAHRIPGYGMAGGFSSDGKRFCTGNPFTVWEWSETAGWQQLWSIQPEGLPTARYIGQLRDSVLLHGCDTGLSAWELGEEKPTRLWELPLKDLGFQLNHFWNTFHLGVTDDGKTLLASVTRDGKPHLAVWDVGGKEPQLTGTYPLPEPVSALRFVSGPASERIYFGTKSAVLAFDRKAMRVEPVKSVQPLGKPLGLSPDGTTLLTLQFPETASRVGELMPVDGFPERPRRRFLLQDQPAQTALGVPTTDGRWMVCINAYAVQTALWELKGPAPVLRRVPEITGGIHYVIPNRKGSEMAYLVNAHDGKGNVLSGRQLADGTATVLWEISGLDPSPPDWNGDRLVARSADQRHLLLYAIEGNKPRQLAALDVNEVGFKVEESIFYCLSPDNQMLVAWVNGRQVVYDLSALPPRVLAKHEGTRQDGTFLPDGRFAYRSAFGEHWVRIEDYRPGGKLSPLELPAPSFPLGFRVSPGGRYLVVGYQEDAARLWDLSASPPTYRELPTRGAADFWWTRDGRHLIINNANGTMWVLRFPE